jgi:hypothetical protein
LLPGNTALAVMPLAVMPLAVMPSHKLIFVLPGNSLTKSNSYTMKKVLHADMQPAEYTIG